MIDSVKILIIMMMKNILENNYCESIINNYFIIIFLFYFSLFVTFYYRDITIFSKFQSFKYQQIINNFVLFLENWF